MNDNVWCNNDLWMKYAGCILSVFCWNYVLSPFFDTIFVCKTVTIKNHRAVKFYIFFRLVFDSLQYLWIISLIDCQTYWLCWGILVFNFYLFIFSCDMLRWMQHLTQLLWHKQQKVIKKGAMKRWKKQIKI